MHKILITCLILLFAGCAATGPEYSTPPKAPDGKALVYFMNSTKLHYVPIGFCVDDSKVAFLGQNGYSWIHLDEGKHRFSQAPLIGGCPSADATDISMLNFNMYIAPNQEYFIEFTQERTSYDSFISILRSLSPDTGSIVIHQYKYIERKK